MIQFECIDVSLEAILDVVNNITMRTQEILHIHLPNAMEFNLVLLMILQTSETLTLPQCSQICFACIGTFGPWTTRICLSRSLLILQNLGHIVHEYFMAGIPVLSSSSFQ